MNYKIGVISTGGTIGSTLEKGVVNVSNKQHMLAQLYQGENSISIDMFTPYNILSENISRDNASQLLQCIKGIDCSDYDGIIVTHGTDTLAYTANYLDIILHDYAIPIVLVSSNYPMEDSRSNAVDNFTTGVDFICQKNDSGVFVSYTNVGAEPLIHKGSLLMQAREIDGFVDSICSSYYAKKLTNGIFEYNDNYILSNEKLTIFNKNASNAELNNKLTGELCNDIMYIKAFAFMNFDIYAQNISDKTRAIVIELYHSGTLPTQDFIDFVRKIEHLNIYIVLTSASIEDSIYESFSSIRNNDNFIICVGKSIENTIVKTMLALGSNFDTHEVKNFLKD